MNTARDLVGYGATPPPAQWPGGARIAVQFVINYEEGAENCVLNGDAGSEAFLSEMVGAQAQPGARAMAMESLYEYGSRAGFWRLHRLFAVRGVPVTVFGVANALAANPEAVAAMQAADWEIASHGLRWIDYQHIDEATERAHIAQAIAVHTQVTGSRPLGWYQGRTSPNTARLIAEEGGFVYDADSYADDVPYYDARHGRTQLIVPYTLDANDMKFVAYNGFADGEPFFRYLRDGFEQLRSEGGRMLSIGLHGRIAGKPARTAALARFVDHVLASGDAWVARRIDIARHWLQVHPA
ncbi:allantoinase PuuE [Xanthomonas floridensis]|uniref:Allantoinase PuuE n=1 Tax=Xanthomonas floridensis TaxID=1843580 RepID=A0A1A9M941_9XANT|nr:allantoinase PuuE [Xanthomonas floridensis]MEA5125501.1 allantoinase PuuE [Xanthomonas floridensis]MEA5133310.1 allantoinase PuuE [Xanthomonas floridensis]OAG67044.1 chitin deacetylase [Xanthomonas floridensis]